MNEKNSQPGQPCTPADAETSALLENLHRAFDQRSWHGPNLMGAVRGLKPEEASWRPQPDRHNAWEYLVHAAYWKYRIVRLIAPHVASAFSLKGSNFFERPVDQTQRALREDVELLKEWHARLIEVVEALDPSDLAERRGDFDVRSLILGIAGHDIYHAGQIRLLRRMWVDAT